MQAVLSVDLAVNVGHLGICLLQHSDSGWYGRFVETTELDIARDTEADALATTLHKACVEWNVGILLLDGPQAWKDPANGLAFCRKCEHVLHTPAKTGEAGVVRPKSATRFVEFSISTFAKLIELGAMPVRGRQIELLTGAVIVAESFPTAAWRSIGHQPLPSRSRVSLEEIERRCLTLQQDFGVSVKGEPTHDRLQALVSGLAGIAIAEGRSDGYEVVGEPPRTMGAHVCEGFIVNPRRSVRTTMDDNSIERLRNLVFERLNVDRAESARVEWKSQLLLSPAAPKAEFIRDVLSLANSEGEHPRTPGYLLVGAKAGKVAECARAPIDGATIGQIITSLIAPKLDFEHHTVPISESQNIDLLELRPSTDALYVVNRELRDDHKVILRPGETWGRHADRKIQLDGAAIVRRISEIVERRSTETANPLRREIQNLRNALADAGPRREVVRIIYELEHHMEAGDWNSFTQASQKLDPYLRDDREAVADAVLDRLGLLLRVRFRMPQAAAVEVLGIARNCLPHYSHQGKSFQPISEQDVAQYKHAADIAWEAAYDAIKYVQNLRILESACQILRAAGRVANLNNCQELSVAVQKHFVELRDLCLNAELREFLDVVIYFEKESRLENPELPPVFKKIYF